MKRGSVLLVALLTTGCGMTVGIRPATESVTPTGIGAVAVERGETVVAGVTLTTVASGSAIVASADPTDGEPGPGSIDPDTSTPVPSTELPPTTITPATSTSTSTPSTTAADPGTDSSSTTIAGTTTTSVPPSSSTSVPELQDIGTVFSEDDAFVTHDCAGGDVTISGDEGTFTLEGVCRAVLVRGSSNTVFIDELGSIDLTGTLNAVVYGSGNPVINDWDGDNIVTGG